MAEALKECRYYRVREGKLICVLCPHRCVIEDGHVGKCRVRERRGDKLYALTYGRVTSAHLDPIEKKPLYHFHPGAAILSLGTWGCSFSCTCCQNWQISQRQARTEVLEPADAVKLARSAPDNIGIAYTYNEPLIWYEYVEDTAKLAREAGLKNVLVTNGYVTEEPLRELLPLIDAMNIDVKSMSDDFYRRIAGARVRPVLRAAEIAARSTHVEITNLVIPGENDSDDDLRALADWVAEKLGVDTPLHFSRYHPAYRMSIPATPERTLSRAYAIARTKLRYVYIGNVATDEGQDTTCPHCGRTVISRQGFYVADVQLQDGKCGFCGEPVAVVTG
jgi:pyruvate formate lyase activating enzyme